MYGQWQQVGGSITFNADKTFKSFGSINEDLFSGDLFPNHLLLDGEVSGTFAAENNTVTLTPGSRFRDIGFIAKSISYRLETGNQVLILTREDGSSLKYTKVSN